MFWHSSRAQSAPQDQICRSFEGIIYAASLRELYSFQFSLAEVEFLEQYGNENVEAKWMGKYDERCGKKLGKESPLYKTFLEDKYEKKCWLDDAFKLFTKSFDALKRHCFKLFLGRTQMKAVSKGKNTILAQIQAQSGDFKLHLFFKLVKSRRWGLLSSNSQRRVYSFARWRLWIFKWRFFRRLRFSKLAII